MAGKKVAFDDLLAVATRGELRCILSNSHLSLTLPEALRLAESAQSLEPAALPLRLGIVHTYTSNLLDPWLELAGALQGLKLETYHAPYGFTFQEAQAGSGLVAHAPDLTLIMLRREDLHPDLARQGTGQDVPDRERLGKEVIERLLGMLCSLRAHKIGQIVVTILPSLRAPALGIYDAQAETPEAAWWAGLKAEIGRSLRESVRSSLFLDLDALMEETGREGFFDRRYWYSAQFPFTAVAAREFARRVISVGAVMKLPKAKVIVLDADNTLWGGIIGEDGLNGIALGPEYPGNAYVEFQKRLVEFQRRGFILALCSKNNPADVEQVFKEHPHQVLRENDFAAQRVNWLPKPDNLASLAEELNLGLDSIIFVDDSDHECGIIRHRFPQVEVVQTPTRPVDIPTCLDQVARLEVLSLTAEDLGKTELYAQERRRRELSATVERGGGGVSDYLSRLEISMKIRINDGQNVTRLAQLTQKTNQFNLTTRRYSEQQMQEFILAPDWLIACFSLSDVFGDSGVVGLAMFHRVAAERAVLDTFLMSCRVIGREAEAAFLQALLRHLVAEGATEVVADFKPTSKNDLAKSFLSEQGFEKGEEGRYRRDLRSHPPKPESAFPIAIDLEGARRGTALTA
jgi:FkbH-like protein